MRSISPALKPAQILAVVLLALGLVPVVRGASKYKLLHNFGSGKDGSGPYGPPVLDKRGKLYGVTGSGGTGQCSDYGCGTAYELLPQANGTWKEVILHDFTSGSGGAGPWGSLVLDGTGNLYGTMPLGTANVGGVFRLTPGSGGWAYSVLYAESSGPGLFMDKLGNLYGQMAPGEYNYGAVARLSPGPSGWTYTALYSFCRQQNCPDGDGMPAPPIWDGKGNLFGTTTDGGIVQPACWTYAGCGVIFKMTPSGDGTWTYHILHRFASFPTDGQTPDGGLVMDASGTFYGTTALGGAHGNGTLFKLSESSGHWKQTVLYDFPNCADGCAPGGGSLVFDKAGNLYGPAGGGSVSCGYYCGVVFKLTPQKTGTWTYSVVHKFTGKDGAFPWGVIVDDKGNLFGTTENGGTYNSGVAFEITP